MHQNTYIKKFIAASLLLVFALSITPTKVLHYWFANHNDSLIKLKDSKYPSLSVAGFNCQIDNLVVESPFTLQCHPVSLYLPEVINCKEAVPVTSFHCADYFFFELRGPPFII